MASKIIDLHSTSVSLCVSMWYFSMVNMWICSTVNVSFGDPFHVITLSSYHIAVGLSSYMILCMPFGASRIPSIILDAISPLNLSNVTISFHGVYLF